MTDPEGLFPVIEVSEKDSPRNKKQSKIKLAPQLKRKNSSNAEKKEKDSKDKKQRSQSTSSSEDEDDKLISDILSSRPSTYNVV